ncbi:hypothetical protein [Microbacterium sp.]|uniref:hypothetical protein n=1 Tax=Microbacterium sp. TaxID=51671 RepID=UPI001ACCE702|nr:hypothetical protein [Microbacterium sp.]MBN9156871.1 hypothetical protein [Microbacterium sp.]MBS1900403.1 hypothetical protein [Actinomycetota bacterium]
MAEPRVDVPSVGVDAVERPSRAIAIATLCSVILLLALSLFHAVATNAAGLVTAVTGRWDWAEWDYLGLVALLAAVLLVHAAQDERAMFPRTIATAAVVLGSADCFLMYWKWVLLAPPPLNESEPSWLAVAANFMFVLTLMPFAMAFVAGFVMRRVDHTSARFRVGMTAIVVGTAMLLIALAMWMPRLAASAGDGSIG